MKPLPILIACLLTHTLLRAQDPITNLAAPGGLSVSGPTVSSVDNTTASWPQLIAQLTRDPRNHVFRLSTTLRNETGNTVSFSLGFGEVDFVDASLGSKTIAGGRLRPTPPGSDYLQRQANLIPLSIPAHTSLPLTVTIRQRTDELSFDGIYLYDSNALNTAFARDLPASNATLIVRMLFMGFLLCQLIYMLSQWLMVRRKEYLYYLLYMTLIAVYFLSKQESIFGVDILFTRWPLLTIYLGKTLLILPYFIYFRFIRSFLEIPRDHPVLNRWIIRLENFLLLYAVIDLGFILLTFNRPVQTEIYTVVFALVFLLTIGFMIYMYRRGGALVYFVISGSLFVATGHILGLIFSYLEINRHQDLGVPDIFIFPQAGIILEVLCFTAGLSYKSRMTEKEKIVSQEKLIEQLKANELLQNRMQQIRNKIAQDLHDDIGSTLSSISILSDLALRGNSSAQTVETINEIKDSSMMLMERMDDIVWSISPRNDSLENLLMRVRHFATTLFEAKGIEYYIDIQKNINEIDLPIDYRQHIYLILKEAINNLVKYALASQAFLEVSFDEQQLNLTVRDNGRGFDPATPSTGNGITGMQRRAALMNARLSIRSAPGEGTSIGLRVGVA
ncbi:MAG TPA: 7TM diverse intracellular signaling domain-containing protein [Puia sp.]|nr:7TM diverse intracellular signaling domain-containing protein [Puia sp.]